jgi:Flp pilus assembly pilin Flp
MTVHSQQLRALISDCRGVTALEYGLIGTIMGGLVIAAFTSIWAPLSPAFTIIGNFLVATSAAGF